MNLVGIQIILIIVALGITNGFINLHAVDCKNDPIKCKKYSKLWHIWMAIMKAQLAILIISIMFIPIEFIFTFKMFFFWALLWFNASWTIYDFTINCIRKYYENVASIWRVDDGSINGWIKGLIGVAGIWILRGILIIVNILIII